MKARGTVHFPGPCPFLMCIKIRPHDHRVCPRCGAVGFGNAYCPDCRLMRLPKEDKS